MDMSILRSLVTILLATQLMACATIFNGSTERIEIVANVNDTIVYVNDVYVGKSGPNRPLDVVIPKRGQLTFTGKKPNCSDAVEPVTRRFDPVTLLGLVIDFGLISILVVDWVGTNAVVRSSYQSYYLSLGCSS